MPPEGGDPYYEDEQGEDGEYYEGEEEALWVMDAPWFKNADEQNALFVCWKPFPDATGYELQMMKCMKKHPKWVTLAPNLQGCEVKKKVSRYSIPGNFASVPSCSHLFSNDRI